MKKLSLILVALFFTCAIAVAQKTVTGNVTDQNGDPLIGASVIAEGTTVGTITDIDGNFSLQVPEGVSDVVVSYTGFDSRTIDVSNSSSVVVALAEGTLIDEVVVTALGVSREKKSLGYSVQELSTDDLNKVEQTDALSALTGKVAGAQLKQSGNIGGSKQILLRGSNSFFGDNNPLIVIDGLPVSNANYNTDATSGGSGGVDYGNMLNDLNMDDIESISVLKGTGAAIYGSRAANGVILIKTKSGKNNKENFGINFSTSIAMENVYKMPEIQQKYGGGAFISDEDGGQDGFQVVNIEGTDYLVPQYGVDESWGPAYDENINVLHWDAFSKDYPDEYLNPRPWVAPENGAREFFNTGINLQNSVSAFRSGDKYSIRAGYSNMTSNGVVPGSKLSRNNVSLNSDFEILPNLNLTSYISYVKSETVGRPTLGYPGSGQRYGNTLGQTLFQWTQTNIDYQRSEDHLYNDDGSQNSWNRNAWDDPTPHYSDNHHWIAYENFNDDERDRVLGNVGLAYQLTEGLRLTGRASADAFSFYNRERVAVGSQAQSSYYEAVRNNYEYNIEGKAIYQSMISDNFSFDAMVGVNQMRTRYNLNRGETSGGLIVPNVYNLKNSTGTVLTNDITEQKQINSVFGQVGLGLANMLFLDLTARNDWSSTLPADNNSYFYPSASLSFVLSEIVSNDFLSFAKVRAGWARVGKDTDPYRVLPLYSFNEDGPFQGDPRVFTPVDLLNANLLPELTTSFEAGVELAFFNNRLGVDFTYFNNVTNNQIIPLEVSKATGYNAKYINAGEIQNSGVELAAFLTPIRTNNFDWTINVNFTRVNNTVNEIAEGIEAIDIARAPFGGTILRASVGERYGQLWGYDYLYDDAGNKVVGENGYWMQTQELVPLGSVLPDYTMGIGSNMNLGNLSFNFLFDIQQGGKFYSVSHMWGHYAGTWAPTAGVNDKGNEIRDPVADGGGIKLDGVTGDVEFNEDGTYTVSNTAPNETYVGGQGWAARHYHGFGFPSAQSVFDADYIKLRELSLGYDFDLANSDIFRNLRITFFGRNLWTGGLDYPGLDPEVTVAGSGNIQGIEGGFLPTTRSFGVKLGFGL